MASPFSRYRQRQQTSDPIAAQADEELKSAVAVQRDAERTQKSEETSWMKERMRQLLAESKRRQTAADKVVRGPTGQPLREESNATKRVLTDDTTGEQFVQRSDGALEPAAANAPMKRENGRIIKGRPGMQPVDMGEDPVVRDQKAVEANLAAAEESTRIAEEALKRQQGERDIAADQTALDANLAGDRAASLKRQSATDFSKVEPARAAEDAAMAAQEASTKQKSAALAGKRETMAKEQEYGAFSGLVRRQKEAVKRAAVKDGPVPANYLMNARPGTLQPQKTPTGWKEGLSGDPVPKGAPATPDAAQVVSPDQMALEQQEAEDNAYLAERAALEAADDETLMARIQELDTQVGAANDQVGQRAATVQSGVADLQRRAQELEAENQQLLASDPAAERLSLRRGEKVEEWHPSLLPKLEAMQNESIAAQTGAEEANAANQQVAGAGKNSQVLRDYAVDLAKQRAETKKVERKAAVKADADKLRAAPHLARFGDELEQIEGNTEARLQRVDSLFSDPKENERARQVIQEEDRASREFLAKDIQSASKAQGKRVGDAYQQVRAALPGVNLHWAGKTDPEKDKAWKDYSDKGKALDEQVEVQIWKTSKETGVPEADIRKAMEKAAERDWTGSPESEKARVLSDGNVIVKPEHALTEKNYRAAVEASNATPEQKAKALENMQAERRKVADAIAPMMAADEEGVGEGLAKFMVLPGGIAAAQDYGFVTWQKNHPELAQGPLSDQILTYFDTQPADRKFMRHMGEAAKSALTSLSKSAAGAGAALTDSETLHGLMTVAGNVEGIQNEYRARTGVDADMPKALGFTPGEAYATLLQSAPSIVGGALNPAVAAILAGAQSGGGTYADAYQAYKSQGMDEESARRLARAPALLSAASTGFLTAAGGATGLEGLSKLLNNTAQRNALHATLKARLAEIAKGTFVEGLKGGVREALFEEIPDQMIQGMIQMMTYNPNLTVEQYFEQAAKAGVGGFFMGGTMDGVIHGLQESERNRVAAQSPNSAAPLPPEQWAAALDSINRFDPPDMPVEDIEGSKLSAEAILYTARGQINDVSDEALHTVGVERNEKGELVNSKGVVNPMVKIENGQPIISDAVIDWMKTYMPGVGTTIGMDEATARAKATQAAAPAATGQNASASTTQTPGQATGQTSGQTAPAAPIDPATVVPGATVTHGGRPRVVESVLPAVGTVEPQVIFQDEMGKPYPISSVSNAAATPAVAPAPAAAAPAVAPAATASEPVWSYTDDAGQTHTLPVSAASSVAEARSAFARMLPPGQFVAEGRIQRPAAANNGKGGSPAQARASAVIRNAFGQVLKMAQDTKQPAAVTGAIKVAGALTEKWVRRYADVFDAVMFTTEKVAPYMRGKTLYLNPEVLAGMVKADPRNAEAVIRSTLREEVLHGLMTGIDSPRFASLWTELPPSMRNRSRNAYEAASLKRLAESLGRAPTQAEIDAHLATLAGEDDANRGEEFLRQVLQKEFWNEVTELVRLRPDLGEFIISILNDLAAALDNLMSTITGDATRKELESMKAEVLAAAAQIGGLDVPAVAPAAPAAATKAESAPAAAPVTAAAKAPAVEIKPGTVDGGAHEAAASTQNNRPAPTPAQIEAENYKVGKVVVGGVDVSVETPAGSKRRPEWPALKDHYGRIPGTRAQDGELVDVFVVPGTPLDYSGPAFVVQQVNPKTGKDDEVKVIIGAKSAKEAAEVYHRNYQDGWEGFGGIPFRGDMTGLKTWLKEHTAENKQEKAPNDQKTPQAQVSQSAEEMVGTPTPNGARARIVWDVIDAAEAAATIEDAINENQTRQRSGDKASEKQRLQIASNPDVNLLGESSTGMNGAPMVDDAEGKTIAGNGRMGGIVQGYANPDGSFAKAYKPFVVAQAEQRGLGDKAKGMEQPVLIRRIVGYENGSKADFVSQNNPKGGGLLRETRANEGLSDLKVLSPLLGDLSLTKGGVLTTDSVYAVAQALAKAGRPLNENTKGEPDADEALRRVQQATLADMARRAGRPIDDIVTVMESDTGKRVLGELMRVAPDLSRMEMDLSLSTPIMEALMAYRDGIAAVKSGAFANLADWAQNMATELVGNNLSPESAILLDMFVRADKRPTVLRNWFDAYTMMAGDENYERKQAGQSGDIFGEPRPNVESVKFARKATEGQNAPGADETGAGDSAGLRRSSPEAIASDEEYLAAVEAGDAAKAQKLVSKTAKASGYEIEAYHKTSAKEPFYEFDVSRGDLGAHFGTKAQASNLRSDAPGAVMRVFLNLENPIRLQDKGGFHADSVIPQLARNRTIKMMGALSDQKASRLMKLGDGTASERKAANAEVRALLKSLGYDGVVYSNKHEGAGDSYIAFSPEQIKSGEAVTHDASGVVIPLSERFTSSPDIRRSAEPFNLEQQTETDVERERRMREDREADARAQARQERIQSQLITKVLASQADLQQGRLFAEDGDLFAGPTAEQILRKPSSDLFGWAADRAEAATQPSLFEDGVQGDLFGNQDINLVPDADKAAAARARAPMNEGERMQAAMKRGMMSTTKAVQTYLDSHDVPRSEQGNARKKIAAIVEPVSNPAEARRAMVAEAREQAATAYRGAIAGDVGVVRAAFEQGDSISAILRQFVNGEVPSFDIRGAVIRGPEDFARFNLAIRNPYFEVLKVAVLGDNAEVIYSSVVSVGSLAEAVAAPRDIIRAIETARQYGVPRGFMIAHNHPSGDPNPSEADRRFTRRIEEVGETVNVPFVDHVVTNGATFYSFQRSGTLGFYPYVDDSVKSKVEPDGQLGDMADFEAVPSAEFLTVDEPAILIRLVETMRKADPGSNHLFFLNTKGKVVAIQRVPSSSSSAQLAKAAINGAATYGGASVALGFDPNLDASVVRSVVRDVNQALTVANITFTDAWDGKNVQTFKQMGVLEAPSRYASEDPRQEANSDAIDFEAMLAELERDLPSDSEIEELTGIALAEHKGARTVGNPDVAGLGEDDIVDTRRHLDVLRQYYDLARERETFEQWDAVADRMLRDDPMAVKMSLLQAANEGTALDSPELVRAASKLIPQLMQEALLTRNPTLMREAKLLTWAYARGGTEQARAFTARQDRFKTREERRAEYMTKLMFDVNPQVRAKIEAAITPAEKTRRLRRIQKELADARAAGDDARAKQLAAEEKLTKATKDQAQILDEATALRLKKVEAALAREGITIDDVLDGRAQVRLNFARIAAQALGNNNPRREKVIDLIIHGWPTKEIVKATGYTADQVDRVASELTGNNQALRQVIAARVRSGFRATDFVQPEARRSAEPVRAGAETLTEEQIQAEVDRIMKLMVPTKKQRDSGKWKPQTRKEAPAAAPQPRQESGGRRTGVPGRPIPDGPFVPDPNPATRQDVLVQGGQLLTPEQQANINAQRQPAAVLPSPVGAGPQGRLAIPRTDRVPSGADVGGATGRQGNLPITTGPAAPTGDVDVGGTATRQGRLDVATEGERQPAGVLPAGPSATRQGKLQLDPETTEFMPRTRDDIAQDYRIARIINTAESTVFDMVQEYFINAILSGPATQIVNVLGNLGNGLWEYTAQRGMEMLTNAFVGDKGSAQFGEVLPLLKGLQKGIPAAFINAAKAFDAESDVASATYLNQQAEFETNDFDRVQHIKAAIPGKTGRTVRIFGRALLMMDSFFKTIFGQMEVGAQAYRLGRAQGMKGAELEEFIEKERRPGSASWIRAMDKAKDLTFQTDIKNYEEGGHFADNAVSHVQRMMNNVRALKFNFPFIKTPYNIFKTGLRKSPLGAAPLLANLMEAGFFKMKDGKPVFDSYAKADMVKHVSEQVLAFMALAYLFGAVEGDDDDDKKFLLLTGGRGGGHGNAGARELQKRRQGGAYQIRIGGKWIPYGRLEPFATTVGVIADAVHLWKSNRQGRQLPAAMFSRLVGMTQEKTFLQGLSRLTDTLTAMGSEDFAETAEENLTKTLLESLIPNIIRQPLRNSDDLVRNFKASELQHSALPSGAHAEPAISEYGNQMVKEGPEWLRMMLPLPIKPEGKEADEMLENFARENPQEAYYPGRSTNATYKVPGVNPKTGKAEPVPMTDDEQKTALDVTRGKIRDEMLKQSNLLTPENVKNPSFEVIEQFKDIRSKANQQADKIIKRPDWREAYAKFRENLKN